METEISGRVRNVELVKIIDWIPKVWHHLNRFLEAHSSSDVTIGRWEARWQLAGRWGGKQGGMLLPELWPPRITLLGVLTRTALCRHKSTGCCTVHTDREGVTGMAQERPQTASHSVPGLCLCPSPLPGALVLVSSREMWLARADAETASSVRSPHPKALPGENNSARLALLSK